jgi:hypothetical protein
MLVPRLYFSFFIRLVVEKGVRNLFQLVAGHHSEISMNSFPARISGIIYLDKDALETYYFVFCRL